MEPLADPLNDRCIKSVPAPPSQPLSYEKMFPYLDKPGVPDYQLIRKHLDQGGRIESFEFKKLIQGVTEQLKTETNLVQVQEPVIIAGDIHGQYYDLIHMFQKLVDTRTDFPNMVFLGDYVDRGSFSIEVIQMLFALKLTYPKKVTLLRGNHETRAMTSHFTFRSDCLARYGDESMYELILECFNCLPVAALVNQDYLCVHGGISPELKLLKQINDINRFVEPEIKGLLCDLLWSDPVDDQSALSVAFQDNKERDCSFKFGQKPVQKLIKDNNLLSVIRGHQVQVDGYKMHRWGQTAFPQVITVFSAPNYCGTYSNKGAIILIEGKMNIKQYKESAHPFILPNDIDLFSWSLPFLAEKVTEMLVQVIGRNRKYSAKSMEDIDSTDLQGILKTIKPEAEGDSKQTKEERLRNKVRSIARMSRMYKNLRENAEQLVLIKQISSDGKIPRGLLLEGLPAIKHALKEFDLSKKLDAANERNPGARVFQHGSNHPEQIARRLGYETSEIWKRTVACVLHNHVRCFAGEVQTWEGKSVSTVIPSPGNSVLGIGVYLTPTELKQLDCWQNVPIDYQRHRVQIQIVEKGHPPRRENAEVYIRKMIGIFDDLSDDYLKACVSLQRAHFKLAYGDDHYEDVVIQVRSAIDMEVKWEYEATD